MEFREKILRAVNNLLLLLLFKIVFIYFNLTHSYSCSFFLEQPDFVVTIARIVVDAISL